MLETMLDYLRFALYTLLLILGVFLYQAWTREHPVEASVPVTETAPSHYLTEIAKTAAPAISQPEAPSQLNTVETKGELITVTTNLLQITIDTRGGDIVGVNLLKYPESLNSKMPFVLLNDDAKTRYIAESGLLSKRGPDTPEAQAIYQTTKTTYALAPNEESLTIPLVWKTADGLTITKNIIVKRGSYEIGVSYAIKNDSTAPWEGNLFAQLMRTDAQPENHGGVMNLSTYFGAAVSSPEKPFQKITFKEMREKPLNQVSKDGWAAMIQHYFISAWIPGVNATSTYYTKAMPNGLYTVGLIGPKLSVPQGSSASTEVKLYTGPTIGDQLEKAAPNLKLTIDYGWFWFISAILFWMMQHIYDIVGNWGWSIVIITIIIKLVFYPFSAKSYRSMSALKKLQPRIEILKERFGDDKQKLTQATLELYKTEKVNPMSGCLPVLIQIPVFIALYWVLVESVQLRQAPFILWIKDLSQADPYYILPILMGLSMFLQQRLNPPPPDPLQAKIMMFMPVIFTVLFVGFPAGLMLYWFVNNTLSFLQQWYVMHQINQPAKSKVKG